MENRVHLISGWGTYKPDRLTGSSRVTTGELSGVSVLKNLLKKSGCPDKAIQYVIGLVNAGNNNYSTNRQVRLWDFYNTEFACE